MNQQLFRKKSVDKVSSPEQLNEYIRVANPGVWMVLAAIVILLAGVVVWGFIGHLDTTLDTAVVCENGEAVIYVKEADAEKIAVGMTVRVDDKEYTVSEIPTEPKRVDDTMSEYAVHASGLTVGEWVYAVKVNGDIADGVQKAKIVIESISPISFILN
jgi:hypothetical protein